MKGIDRLVDVELIRFEIDRFEVHVQYPEAQRNPQKLFHFLHRIRILFCEQEG